MVSELKGGETVLTGLLEDRSALFGVLTQIEALGLELRTYYLQRLLGYSPVKTGLAFRPMVAANILTSTTTSTVLLGRIGRKPLVVGETAVASSGVALLTGLGLHSRYASDILPALLLIGIGFGFAVATSINTATAGITPADSGIGTALVNTSQQVGGSIGLAILSTLAASRTTSLLHGLVTPGSVPAARVSGFRVAFIAAAVLLGATWAVAALQLRTRHVREPKRVDVPPDLAARAVGCAQCAPVAVTSSSARQPDQHIRK